MANKQAADVMHSDDDLGTVLEVVNPQEHAPGPEAGPSNDELIENSHAENGQSPVIDGELIAPERQNVTAIKDAIEAQAEMEIGKPIEEKQEEVEIAKDKADLENKAPAAGSTTVERGDGGAVTINITIASMQKKAYVRSCPGHKNSKGESAPWCIYQHESGKLLSSHKTKAQAKKHLQDMHAHSGSADPRNHPSDLNPNSGNVGGIGGEHGAKDTLQPAGGPFGGVDLNGNPPSFEKHSEGELPAKRIKRINSHVGLSRYMQTLADTDTVIDRIPEIKTPYAYSPDWTVYKTQDGRNVFIAETAHKTYDVFEVPAGMTIKPRPKEAADKTAEVTATRPLTCYILDEMGDTEEAGHVNTTAEAAQWYRERGIDIYGEVDAKDDGTDTTFVYTRMASWNYPAYKKAFTNTKTAGFLTLDEVKQAGREYLNMVRTAAIRVSQGEDDKGFHMLLDMNGREYVLYGQDAETFRREWAAIPKPEAAVNKLVEKYLWKLQPYTKKTVPVAQETVDLQKARSRAEELADADAYWEGKEKAPGDYKRYYQQPKAPQQKAQASKEASPVQEKADYWGYDSWITGHTALMIDNTEVSSSTKLNLTRNALKKQMDAKELGAQFARFFKKQEKESRDLYEENAADARGRRGKYEQDQLEGRTPEPTGNKAKDFVEGISNIWYEAGGVSDWEEPAGPVDWLAIAEAAMEEERIQNPDKYKATTKKDDEFMKGVGMKMESLKTAKKPMPQKGSPEWHQLKIAIKTLQMNDAMAGVMGGPDKAQSRQIVAEYGIDPAKYEGATTTAAVSDSACPQCGKNNCKHQSDWANSINEQVKKLPSPKKGGEGAGKTPEEIEKEAGFNFFIPGQVLQEFYPDLQHEIVDYPNDRNTPMQYPDIMGDKDSIPSEIAIESAVEATLDGRRTAFVSSNDEGHYVSTDPAGAMGIGRDGKPQTLDGVGFRREDEIRGPMFFDEFYENTDTVPGAAFQSTGSKRASAPAGAGNPKTYDHGAGQQFMEEYHAQYAQGPAKIAALLLKLIKTAGADEAKQFSLFLQKVTGEIAATFVAAFKVTSRPILDKVPGTGEIQLANIEQPQGMSSFNLVNTQSRTKYLLDKLTDSEVQDAINEAFAQAAVWHDGGDGGYVYEVFVRIESIDTDSMIAKYKFVCGTKE